MVLRHIAFLALAMALAACSADSEDKVVGWFSETERTVHVTISAPALEPYFQTRTPGSLNLRSTGANPLAKVMLLPVIGIGNHIVGAHVAEPEVTHYDLSHVAGATSLFEAAGPDHDLPTLLRRELTGLGPAETGHRLVVAWPDTDGGRGDPDADPRTRADNGTADLKITLTEYALVGRLEDDPAVRLLITGITRVWIDGHDARFVCLWSWGGQSHRMSELSADGAKLFRERVAKAAAGIAQNVARDLRSVGRTCANPAYIWDDPPMPEPVPADAPQAGNLPAPASGM